MNRLFHWGVLFSPMIAGGAMAVTRPVAVMRGAPARGVTAPPNANKVEGSFMDDFEAAIRAIHRAACRARDSGTPGDAGDLSAAIHQYRPVIERFDKLHESFDRTRQQLVQTCFDWLEAASADGSFTPTLNGQALADAREICDLTEEFGQFIKGLKT